MIEIGGRQGHAAFINGRYEEDGNKFFDGKPVFKNSYVMQGLHKPIVRTLYLFYHGANTAWAIAHQLGDKGIAAYVKSQAERPEGIRGIWQLATLQGDFEPDPNIVIGGCLACEADPKHIFAHMSSALPD